MSRIIEATEVRAFSTTREFRGVAAEGRVMYGMVAPYNVVADLSSFTEELRPRCFLKSTSEAARSLPLHVNHKHDEIPVAKAVGWTDQDDGLYGEFLFDTRAAAQEAARLAAEGYLSSLSVGFLPLPNGSDWDLTGSKPHVVRRECRLLEASLCSVPAYSMAGMIAMRSAGVPNDPRTAIIPTPRLREAKAWLEGIRGS